MFYLQRLLTLQLGRSSLACRPWMGSRSKELITCPSVSRNARVLVEEFHPRWAQFCKSFTGSASMDDGCEVMMAYCITWSSYVEVLWSSYVVRERFMLESHRIHPPCRGTQSCSPQSTRWVMMMINTYWVFWLMIIYPSSILHSVPSPYSYTRVNTESRESRFQVIPC